MTETLKEKGAGHFWGAGDIADYMDVWKFIELDTYLYFSSH